MTRATWTVSVLLAAASLAAPVRAANGDVGSRCSADSECTPYHCVDGVCCETAACGDCQQCDHPDHAGRCAFREPGYDSPACVEGYVCDGLNSDCKRDCHAGVCAPGYYCSRDVTPLCRPQLPLGAACAALCPDTGPCHACEAGQCVDGVCCNARCEGDCVACTRALKGRGADGECGNVAASRAGRQRCDHYPPNSCSRTGLCDGDGACALYAAGTRCGVNLCVRDIQVDLECDGQGQCAPQITEDCRGPCTSDAGCGGPVCSGAGCDAGAACEGGACDAGACSGGQCARPAKAPCASDGDCTAPLRCDFEGRCVDPGEVTQSPSPCAIGRAGSARSTLPAWGLLGLAALWAARNVLPRRTR